MPAGPDRYPVPGRRAGTGNNFGTILLRNDSGSWCELDGEVSITGLSASGRPVTRTINEPVSRNLELSPHAAPAVPHQQLPVDQLAASVPLMAEYRDDHDGSNCAPHWVVPKDLAPRPPVRDAHRAERSSHSQRPAARRRRTDHLPR